MVLPNRVLIPETFLLSRYHVPPQTFLFKSSLLPSLSISLCCFSLVRSRADHQDAVTYFFSALPSRYSLSLVHVIIVTS
jgi:hypothetical protein